MIVYLNVSHLYGRQWRKGEDLGHPQLKVEAKAIEKGPDVNQLTRAQPQGGDSEGADGCQELLKDLIVIPANIVINVPATIQLKFTLMKNQNHPPYYAVVSVI